MPGFDEYADLRSRVGKDRTSEARLHVKRLEEMDQAILRELAVRSVETADHSRADRGITENRGARCGDHGFPPASSGR